MLNKQSPSKVVTSNQDDIHNELETILKRYSCESYCRPIADFSKDSFKLILTWIDSFANKEIILDMGCGTGESSYHLADLYSDYLIIGIDKSISRIERKNQFKKNLPVNVLLVRGELLDLWYLFYEAVKNKQLSIYKQYILYPNPWPKKKLVKRRFHANPIFPFILKISEHIELHTNWKIYAEEFYFSACFFEMKKVSLAQHSPMKGMSNFEQKYINSNHVLFKVEINNIGIN